MKKCNSTTCKSIFPKFYKDKSKSDGLALTCIECRKLQVKKSRDKNRKLRAFEDKICENKKCNKSFETNIYNKVYCSTTCQEYCGFERAKELQGGQLAFQSRRTAVRRIRSRGAKRNRKKYSPKEIELILNNTDMNKVALECERSLQNVTAKKLELTRIKLHTARPVESYSSNLNSWDNF